MMPSEPLKLARETPSIFTLDGRQCLVRYPLDHPDAESAWRFRVPDGKRLPAPEEGSDLMKDEAKTVSALFAELMQAPLQKFPERRQKLNAPDRQGVYLICGPRGKVLHVGSTPRAKGGIAQRLRSHLAANSSFVSRYLGGDGSRLRDKYKFSCLVVANRRQRALLEAYAIGHLCPAHLGDGSGTEKNGD